MENAGKSLAGQVALVTGAAQGMGVEFSAILAEQGATVIATDVKDVDPANFAPEIRGNIVAMIHDVTSAADWSRVIADVEAKFGPISILVNNAGIASFSPLEYTPESDFRRMVEVDQLGVFLGMQLIIPSMRKAGGGSIINIASVASLKGTTGLTAYSAAKWAVRGMTKCAALELGVDNIRVNAVHPGMIDTAMTREMDDPVNQPIPRKASPREVAKTVLFLASSESSYTTGCDFTVDGGMTIAAAE